MWLHKSSQNVLLIATIAFLVYTNTLFNGFAWDDMVVILNNPAINGSPIDLFSGIDAARETEVTPYYRPLTLLSFLIENHWHRLVPGLMHLLNVFLHTGNSILVYLLVSSIATNSSTALLSALIFAIHPVNTEGVAFLSGGRNTLLATFFAISAYLLHTKYLVTNNKPCAIIAAALLMAALFSKETALAIIPFIFTARFFLVKPQSQQGEFTFLKEVSLYTVPVVIYLGLRAHALANAGSSTGILTGMVSRLADNIYIIPRYCLTIIWPFASSMHYVLPEDIHLLALPLAAAWAAIIVATCWLLIRNRNRLTIFGLAWLVAFWLPTSGIIPFPSAPMADRYLYLPAIGLWIIVADQAVTYLANHQKQTRFCLIGATVIMIFLAGTTIRQNRVWKNDLTLFSDFAQKYPEQAFGHHNLGTAYLDLAKNLHKSEDEYHKVLQLDPQFPRIHTQMGYVRLLQGDFQRALLHYNEAVIQNPLDAEALLNRGIVLEKQGRYREAIQDYRRFLAAPDRQLDKARSQIRLKIEELEQVLIR